MTPFGYTMMCEQACRGELVADFPAGEQAGFGLAVISDHYLPWVAGMGPSPHAWAAT
jgi:hypothetical protein